MDINIEYLIKDLLKLPFRDIDVSGITKESQVAFEEYDIAPDRKEALKQFFISYIQSKYAPFSALAIELSDNIIRCIETGEVFVVTDYRLRNNPNEQLQRYIKSFESDINREVNNKRNEELKYLMTNEEENVQNQEVETSTEPEEETTVIDLQKNISPTIFDEDAPFPGKGLVTKVLPTGRKGEFVNRDLSLALRFWKNPDNLKWMQDAAIRKASFFGNRSQMNDLVSASMAIMSNAIADKLSFFAGDDFHKNSSGSYYYPLKMMSKGAFPALIKDELSQLPQFEGIVEHMKSKGFDLDRGYHGEEQSEFVRALIGTPYEDAILQWVWDNPSNLLIRKWIASGVNPELYRQQMGEGGISLDAIAENMTEDGSGSISDIATDPGYIKQRSDFTKDEKSELYSKFLKDKVIPKFENKISDAQSLMQNLVHELKTQYNNKQIDWGQYRENFADTAEIIQEVSGRYLPNFIDVFFNDDGEFIKNMSDYITVKSVGEDTVVNFINPNNAAQRLPIVLRNYDPSNGTFDDVTMQIRSMVKAFGGGAIGDSDIMNSIIGSFLNNTKSITTDNMSVDIISEQIKNDLQNQNIIVDDNVLRSVDNIVNKFIDNDKYFNKEKIDNVFQFLKEYNIDSVEQLRSSKNSILDMLKSSEGSRFAILVIYELLNNFDGQFSEIQNTHKEKELAMRLYGRQNSSLLTGKELEAALARGVRDSQLLPFLYKVKTEQDANIGVLTEEEQQIKKDKDKEVVQFILDSFNFDYRRYGLPFKNFGFQSNNFYKAMTGKKIPNYKLYWNLLGIDVPVQVQELLQKYPEGIPVKTTDFQQYIKKYIKQDENYSPSLQEIEQVQKDVKLSTFSVVKELRNYLPQKRIKESDIEMIELYKDASTYSMYKKLGSLQRQLYGIVDKSYIDSIDTLSDHFKIV